VGVLAWTEAAGGDCSVNANEPLGGQRRRV